MLKSMTGYGEAHGELEGATYIVEIKAVNNRYFKTRVKLPDSVAFLEENIEKLLREEISRGMVTYTLRLKDISENLAFDINEDTLKSYLKALEGAVSSAKVKHPIDIGSLLSLPGVLVPKEPGEGLAARLKELVLRLTHQALDRLKEMQAAEGATLAEDLADYCQEIRNDLERIHSRSKVALDEYRYKLKKRVDALLENAKIDLDETTLAREVAVLAERSDISEEVTRLDSHLKQFDESCQADGQAGRRLDFLTQEMLREANTIASKAVDAQIIQWVVDIKCRVDRIKEQVQNIK